MCSFFLLIHAKWDSESYSGTAGRSEVTHPAFKQLQEGYYKYYIEMTNV